MLKITPGTSFPIVRKLGDPADVSTNYVRAIVRNAKTGAILATIDLTDAGDQRFTGSYAVTATENQYFDITTTVYTDVDYTIKSEVYSEENETYFAATDWSLELRNTGLGGGSDINYKKIKEIFDKALKESDLVHTDDFKTDMASMRAECMRGYTACLNKLDLLEREIQNFEFPEQEKFNLAPVISAIGNLKEELNNIAEKEIPTDGISELLNRHNSEIFNQARESQDNIENKIEDFVNYIEKAIKNIAPDILNQRAQLKDELISKLGGAVTELFGNGAPVENAPDKNLEARKRLFGIQ